VHERARGGVGGLARPAWGSRSAVSKEGYGNRRVSTPQGPQGSPVKLRLRPPLAPSLALMGTPPDTWRRVRPLRVDYAAGSQAEGPPSAAPGARRPQPLWARRDLQFNPSNGDRSDCRQPPHGCAGPALRGLSSSGPPPLPSTHSAPPLPLLPPLAAWALTGRGQDPVTPFRGGVVSCRVASSPWGRPEGAFLEPRRCPEGRS